MSIKTRNFFASYRGQTEFNKKLFSNVVAVHKCNVFKTDHIVIILQNSTSYILKFRHHLSETLHSQVAMQNSTVLLGLLS